MTHTINIERVYSDPAGNTADGFRVFIDRLWPRGESKEKFHYDLWAKETAPSTELRQWYHEQPDSRWEEFTERYLAELSANPAAAELLATLRLHPVITLLYSSHDELHNNAVVLKKYLDSHL